MCALLLLLGWACASGLLSCTIDVANGPARVSGTRVESNTVLRATAFGMPLFRKVIGTIEVSTFLRTGLRIQFFQGRAARVLMMLLSFIAVALPIASVTWQAAPAETEDVPEDLEAPSEHHEVHQVPDDQALLAPSLSHGLLCWQAPSLTPPALEIEMPHMDCDAREVEVPSPTACARAFRASPAVVGALHIDHPLLPALHSIEACLQSKQPFHRLVSLVGPLEAVV